MLKLIKSKKQSSNRNCDNHKAEKKSIDAYVLSLNRFLAIETKYEDFIRFQLLRSRVDKCARGISPACELFRYGFLGSDEVPGVDIHAGILGAGIRTKFQQESLQGLPLIKSSTCSEDHLMQFKSEKGFLTLEEYLNFSQSDEGAANYERKKQGQFSLLSSTAYSENDYFLAKIVAAEIAGFIFSPVVLTVHAAQALMKIYYDAYFEIIENREYGDIAAASTEIEPYWHLLLSSFCHSTYEMYKTTRTEGTIANDILRYFDPFRYPSVVTLLDFLHPYYSGPSWVFGVILQTPYSYYGYYVDKSHHRMPGTQHACLLRSGIKSAEEETEKIDKKIENEEFLQSEDLEKRKKLGKISRTEKKKNRGQKKTEENKNSGLSMLSHMDFGPEDSWKSAIGKCLEGRFGEYHYTFCFFGKFTQGNTLLGTFKDWGTHPVHGKREGAGEEEGDGEGDEVGSSWFSFGRSTNNTDEATENSRDVSNAGSKFSSQLYSDGMICQGK